MASAWIPYVLERCDYVYEHHHKWTGQDFGDQLPSQVFNDRIITCFIDDAFGVASRGFMNIDNITWECDYPHSDSTWPTAPEALMKYLDGVSDQDINKMTHLNAMKHFSFDPFSVRAREKCTVEALRAEASGRGHVARLAKPGGRRRKGEDGIVSVTGFTQR